MTYSLRDLGVVRDADNAFIPNDPENCDWQAYLAWVAAGNTPNPALAEAPKPISTTLSKRVLIERLHAAGLFEKAFEALGGPGSYQYERWSASAYVDTSNQDVVDLIVSIGGDPNTLLTV